MVYCSSEILSISPIILAVSVNASMFGWKVRLFCDSIPAVFVWFAATSGYDVSSLLPASIVFSFSWVLYWHYQFTPTNTLSQDVFNRPFTDYALFDYFFTNFFKATPFSVFTSKIYTPLGSTVTSIVDFVCNIG